MQTRQINQQEQGAAPAKPRVRKDWELFWRIIAGLMLMVIAWVIWVLYQITPRSVVTPLAYAPRSTQQTPAGATETGTSPPSIASAPAVAPGAAGLPASQRAAESAAADLAMDQAQEAARAGAHQSSADVQAAAFAKAQEKLAEKEQVTREGLKLSTELTTPLAEKVPIPGKGEDKLAPADRGTADAAGKVRP